MSTPDFDIPEFLAWARTKPADETYSYVNTTSCALGQFLRETGRARHALVGGYSWTPWLFFGLFPGRERAIPPALATALVGRSFGALVTRLEALLPVVGDRWTTAEAYLADIEQVDA